MSPHSRTTLSVLVLFCVLVMPAQAIVESKDIMPEEFQSEAEKQRFKELVAELRCTVCQNQNLADSNASLAVDLRREVFEMIQAGKTDQEIADFLVARYGDFVLYKPPFKSTTAVLWIGPFVFFIVAVSILIALIIRRSSAPAQPLSGQESNELNRVLQQAAHDTQKKADE